MGAGFSSVTPKRRANEDLSERTFNFSSSMSEDATRFVSSVSNGVSGNVKMTPQQHLKIDPLG